MKDAKYFRENNLKYETENELVIEYINNLELADYIGNHQPKDVIVLADTGYDDKRIEHAIAKKMVLYHSVKQNWENSTDRCFTPSARRWHRGNASTQEDSTEWWFSSLHRNQTETDTVQIQTV